MAADTGKTTDSTMRMERISRLLRELEYEVSRGIMEHEIDETITFRFVLPISRTIHGGVVACEFLTRPTLRCELMSWNADMTPRLKLVE